MKGIAHAYEPLSTGFDVDKIKEELKVFSSKLKTKDVRFIPISALKGDNVVNDNQTI